MREINISRLTDSSFNSQTFKPLVFQKRKKMNTAEKKKNSEIMAKNRPNF